MAVSEPPIDSELIGFDAGAGAAPTEFWRNLWPWDDLNAKSPPEAWQQFHRDVLPVLAALTVPRSPTGPRALFADASGRLAVSSFQGFADRTTRAQVAGGTVIAVADASLYSPGMFLDFPTAQTDNAQALGEAYVCEVIGTTLSDPVNGPFLTVRPAVPVNIASGTFFLALPGYPDAFTGPPWRVPNLLPLTANRVAAGTSVVLAGSGSKRIWVFGVQLIVGTAAAGSTATLATHAGALPLLTIRGDTIHETSLNLGGVPLAAGDGLDFTTAGAVAAAVILSASQL